MLWLIFTFVLQSSLFAGQPSSEDKLLQKGLQLEQQEQYEQALRTWAKAYRELETPSLAIGRAHIRLAAGQKLESHYQTAATLFQWGLSAKEIAPNAEALSEELQMLEPLAADDTFDRWQHLLEQEDSALYEELKKFWQNRDPTLVTTYNERLLEHWERIAYAREHFTRDDDPPYGTDDRGEYWVRYGTPDRQYDGRLKATRGQIGTVCMVLACNSEIMGNAVFELDQRPYYDIWIYEKPNQHMKYNLVLIFGESPSTGFGRVEILEDFIPSRAFSFSNRYSAPSLLTGSAGKASDVMTPGMVMQWIYYKQLAAIDFYFANRFEEMDFKWNRTGPNPALDTHAGQVQEQQTQMTTIKNMKAAPEEVSTYEKEFPSIPLEIHQYRLLDEQNRPVFVTFLESNPQPVFLRDLAANQDSMFADDSVTVGEAFSHYELYHGLQIRNSDSEVISQSHLPTTLALDSTNNEPSHSIFTVPPLANEQSARLYAELHNRHPQSAPPLDSPFPNSLRGQGKIQLEQPDPLYSNPNNLQMGDLILGYQMQEGPQGDGLFPFYVANDRQIPANENLAVHVEVYGLRLGSGGIGRLQLSYQILPVNALGWTQERKQEFSLTLNLETLEPRYTEDLEIQSRELPPGRYVMRMQAEDQQSRQQTEREIEFEVVE